MRIIKKYSNRRLYDTGESSYITLEELAGLIRSGEDVQVLDAKTGEDYTQQTLAQIVVESRGAARLLPKHLLMQLIRMGDDALAEFMTHYVAWALEVYIYVKKGSRKIPGAERVQRGAGQAFGPWMRAYQEAWRGLTGSHLPPMEAPGPPPNVDASPGPPHDDEPEDGVADLRREVDELKKMIRELGSSN